MKNRYLSLAGDMAGGKTDVVDCIFTADKNIDLSGFAVGDRVTVRGKVDWFITVRTFGSRILEHHDE